MIKIITAATIREINKKSVRANNFPSIILAGGENIICSDWELNIINAIRNTIKIGRIIFRNIFLFELFFIKYYRYKDL